jgi:hypothetical protein
MHKHEQLQTATGTATHLARTLPGTARSFSSIAIAHCTHRPLAGHRRGRGRLSHNFYYGLSAASREDERNVPEVCPKWIGSVPGSARLGTFLYPSWFGTVRHVSVTLHVKYIFHIFQINPQRRHIIFHERAMRSQYMYMSCRSRSHTCTRGQSCMHCTRERAYMSTLPLPFSPIAAFTAALPPPPRPRLTASQTA